MPRWCAPPSSRLTWLRLPRHHHQRSWGLCTACSIACWSAPAPWHPRRGGPLLPAPFRGGLSSRHFAGSSGRLARSGRCREGPAAGWNGFVSGINDGSVTLVPPAGAGSGTATLPSSPISGNTGNGGGITGPGGPLSGIWPAPGMASTAGVAAGDPGARGGDTAGCAHPAPWHCRALGGAGDISCDLDPDSGDSPRLVAPHGRRCRRIFRGFPVIGRIGWIGRNQWLRLGGEQSRGLRRNAVEIPAASACSSRH